MKKQTWLIDSTLREGTQAFGFTPSPADKIEIARHIDRLGCDMIEVGHLAAADEIADTARDIIHVNTRAQTLAHSLLRKEEIELAHNTGVDWIGFFLSINPDTIKIKYGKRYSEYMNKIEPCVRYAHDLGLKVRFTCEDASRTPLEMLIDFYKKLDACKTDLIGFADTTGCLYPSKARHTFYTIRELFPSVRLHFHGHNDRGMALANAVEAAEAGWDCFDASVLGIGERGGIAPLTESAITLEEITGRKFNLEQCKHLDSLVWSNLDLDHYHRRRFAHKAGLHCLSVLEHPHTYESLPIGRMGEKRIGVLSKYSGVRSIMAIAKTIGVLLSRDEAKNLALTIKKQNLEIWRSTDLKELILSLTV